MNLSLHAGSSVLSALMASLSDHGDIFELWVSSGCDLWLIFLTMGIIEVERYPPHKSE